MDVLSLRSKKGIGLARVVIAMALCMGLVPVRAASLTVLGGDSFAPTTFVSNGEPSGVLVDLLKRVSNKTGDVYHIRLLPWKRAYEAALRGEGAIMGLSLTPERRELFEFSEPMHYNELQLVVKKDHVFEFTRLSDLKGKTLGGGLGVSYGEEVDAAIQQGLFSMERDTDASARLAKVLQGRLDAAVIGHGMPGYQAILKGNDRLLERQNELLVLPHPLARDPLYLAMLKTMPQREALDRFNKALRALHASGANKASR